MILMFEMVLSRNYNFCESTRKKEVKKKRMDIASVRSGEVMLG